MRNAYDFWDKLDEEQKAGIRAIERKYDENRWWESNDPLIVIEHQVKERFFMMSFIEYRAALEKLLERPVCHLDFACNNERLHQEVDNALKRRRAGIGQSDEQREAAQLDYIKGVEKIARKLPNSIIIIEEDGNVDRSGYDGWLQS